MTELTKYPFAHQAVRSRHASFSFQGERTQQGLPGYFAPLTRSSLTIGMVYPRTRGDVCPGRLEPVIDFEILPAGR